eukprot:305907-Rhodomonas_salina.1
MPVSTGFDKGKNQAPIGYGAWHPPCQDDTSIDNTIQVQRRSYHPRRDQARGSNHSTPSCCTMRASENPDETAPD